jgi:hypothetical protein
MDILQQFYNDTATREAVKAFMVDTLREMAVERVFDKKAVAGIYEGKKAIEKSFDRLEELYATIKTPIIQNSR